MKHLGLSSLTVCLSGALILGAIMTTPQKAWGDQSLEILPGQFTDKKTGTTFNIRLVAEENDATPNTVTLLMGVDTDAADINILCSVHGPRPMVTFGTGNGNFPLQGVQCGTAGGMPVAIDGCRVKLEFHGYAHVHHPKATYLGMMTTEIDFRKEPGASEGKIKMKVYTPKKKLVFEGNVVGATTTSIVMNSCP
jgi:hypothetical protein